MTLSWIGLVVGFGLGMPVVVSPAVVHGPAPSGVAVERTADSALKRVPTGAALLVTSRAEVAALAKRDRSRSAEGPPRLPRQRDSLKNGARNGALVGGLSLAVLSSVWCAAEGEGGCGVAAVSGMLFGAGSGALVGALIDWMR